MIYFPSKRLQFDMKGHFKTSINFTHHVKVKKTESNIIIMIKTVILSYYVLYAWLYQMLVIIDYTLQRLQYEAGNFCLISRSRADQIWVNLDALIFCALFDCIIDVQCQQNAGKYIGLFTFLAVIKQSYKVIWNS